jgi:outer membrane protein assembly factor BamA
MNPSTQRITLAAVLFSAGFFCLTAVSQEPSSQAVSTPLTKIRVDRLVLIGQPDVPLPVQEQIDKSICGHDYDAGEKGMQEVTDRLRDAWQQQGYFMVGIDLRDAQVSDQSAETRTVVLMMKVDAGQQYRLDEIRFQITAFYPYGQSPSSLPAGAEHRQFSADELRAFFPIEQGDIFDTHKLQQGLVALRKAYGTKGFINMSAVPTTQTDEKTARITLTLEIEEGKQFRIGNIKVLGQDPSTSRQRLESSGLISGNIFDPTRLDEFYRDSGMAWADVYPPEDYIERHIDEEKGIVDLILRSPGLDE